MVYIIGVDKESAERRLPKVEKKINKQSANKTVYIDHWCTWYGDSQNDGVTATQLPNGKWLCEITLPVINQTVKSISSTAANAMENASKKAIPLVEQYLSEHPDTVFISRSSIRHYEFYTDELGETCFRENSEYRQRAGKKMAKMHADTAKAMEKAVAKIAKINGTDKGLFVQAIDKSYFKEDDTIKDIQRKIRYKMLGETSDYYIAWEATTIVGNSVIAVGYILED